MNNGCQPDRFHDFNTIQIVSNHEDLKMTLSMED